MKIGIYCEGAGSLGGAEFCIAALAEALRESHEIEIVSHRMNTTLEEWSRKFGVDLEGVMLRRLSAEPPKFGRWTNPWKGFQESRNWQASISNSCDVFVYFAHHLPPFCHAPAGILVVLFPWFDLRTEWPWALDQKTLRKRIRSSYYKWEWKQRLATYQTKIAISEFTQKYAKLWWGIDCEVIYPPTESNFEQRRKENSILSVGRFSTVGNSKKQLEMVNAFGELNSSVKEWEYFCVGARGNGAEDVDYLKRVQASADERTHVLVDCDYDVLKDLYQRSKVFWHAAGFGEDQDADPRRMEHFGISTVDAMAAGCVPVVINKGGQSEIVEHGVSGFLWNTLEELKSYTERLTREERLCQEMSQAARARAKQYGKDVFVSKFRNLLASCD